MIHRQPQLGRPPAGVILLCLLPILALLGFAVAQTAFGGPGTIYLKAPKNSDGFVINLPNGRGNVGRNLTTILFVKESLAYTYTRHLGGQLQFTPTLEGTEVTNPLEDLSGKLLLTPEDGKAVVKCILPREFASGGLVAIEVTDKVVTGKNGESSTSGSTVYCTLTSPSFMMDVPGLVFAANAGSFANLKVKIYPVLGNRVVTLKLRIDLHQSAVHLML